MKRAPLFFLLVIIIAVLMLVIALYIPNSLPAHSDFSAIYNTDLALVNRIPIYSISEVEALAQEHSGIPRENFFLARFPYPPWYALSTFYLGLLPPKVAATLWFELNLIMLFFSIWFLTDGWSPRLRLIAFPLALFFLPVLGALSVGQYDFPVFLGISMLVYALRREIVALTTLGGVLLTFKPHIGALVLLSVLVWLFFSGDNFGRRALRSILIAGGFLFLTGFIADPAWPVSYPKMLFNYQTEGNVTTCSECASLPVWLSRWLFDGSLAKAAMIAAVVFVVFLLAFYLNGGTLLRFPALLLTSSVVATLLISPYLYNYDFMLLLIPFAVLINSSKGLINRILVIACFLIPTFAIALLGRSGNISLILVTILIAILLYFRVKESNIDVPAYAS